MSCRCCHLHKPIYAKGLCNACYCKAYRIDKAKNGLCIKCKKYKISNKSKYYCDKCLSIKKYKQQQYRDFKSVGLK